MTSGMYIPLTLWRALMRSDQTEGPRGGRSVTWENSCRRCNNSTYQSLPRTGRKASTPSQSEKLNEKIRASSSAKQTVVYAATSESQQREDFLRDDFGRFASE